MKLRALVMTSTGIERYLRWLGEPGDPPTLAPARDPPYFKSQVSRRRLGVPPPMWQPSRAKPGQRSKRSTTCSPLRVASHES